MKPTMPEWLDEPPARGFEIARSDFLRYAGASGDYFPLHTDDEYARAAGLPGVFAHGMFSAGLLATALTSWVGAGALRRFHVRFVAKAWPGERLTTRIVGTGHRIDNGIELVDFDCALHGPDGEPKITGSGTAAPGVPAEGESGFDAPATGAPCGTQIVTVDRAAVSNLAAVLRDQSPVYHDVRNARAVGFSDVPAPPTYPFAMVHWGTRPELTAKFGGEPVPLKKNTEYLQQLGHIGNVLVDLMDELGPGLVLHAEQEYRYHRALVVGDVLRGENTITSVEKQRTKSFAAIDTRWTDAQSGAPVLSSRFTVVHIPRPAEQKATTS